MLQGGKECSVALRLVWCTGYVRFDTDNSSIPDSWEGLEQGFQLGGCDLGAADLNQFLWVESQLPGESQSHIGGLGIFLQQAARDKPSSSDRTLTFFRSTM